MFSEKAVVPTTVNTWVSAENYLSSQLCKQLKLAFGEFHNIVPVAASLAPPERKWGSDGTRAPCKIRLVLQVRPSDKKTSQLISSTLLPDYDFRGKRQTRN